MVGMVPSTWKLISAHERLYIAHSMWSTAKDKLHQIKGKGHTFWPCFHLSYHRMLVVTTMEKGCRMKYLGTEMAIDQ